MKLKTPTFPSKGHHNTRPPAPHVTAAHLQASTSSAATPASAQKPADALKKVAGGLASPTRQRNTAAMIAGLAFIILAGALGASVASSFDDSIDVLVARDDIAEGDVIDDSDFRVVQIAAGAGDIEVMAPSSIERLVGQTAAGPIGSGSLIHPDQFTQAYGEQQILIGASLEPNQFPAGGLREGDQVRIIALANRSSRDDDIRAGQEVSVGEIVKVEPLGGDRLHFAVRVPESTANLVVQLVADKQVSLGLLDNRVTLDQVDPVEAEEAFEPQSFAPVDTESGTPVDTESGTPDQVERSLLIEADPAGGVLALRFDLDPAPSLTSFGSDIRNGYSSDLVWANTQDLRGVHCMPAPVDPILARNWIERVTPPLTKELPSLGAPAIIDLGWIDHEGPSTQLAAAADTTLIVTLPDIAEVQALLFQVRRLQALDTNVAIVTIGDTPNDPQEIARLAGVPLAAVLPDDPKVASALAGGKFKPASFKRSMLWRMIGGLAASLLNEPLMMARAEEMDGAAHDTSVAAPSTTPPPPPPGARPTHALPAPPSAAAIAALAALEDSPAAVPAPLVYDPIVISVGESIAPSIAPTHSFEVFEDTVRLGSPAPAATGATLTLSNGEAVDVLVGTEAVTIGRHSQCDIVLNDSQVSRQHGRLIKSAEGWHYVDLGSRNGTALNSHPCTETVLATGDILTIGQTDLTFESTSRDATDPRSHTNPRSELESV